MTIRILLLATALVAAPAAALQTRSISASDKASGAQAHPQLLQEFGGAYAGPQASYVADVGRRVAQQSGLATNPAEWTVTLLDSPVNNAFAIPGGYVYVTRQLLALMNDEAELASVLGHEVGHVAARHSAKRNNASTLTNILASGLGILTGSQGLGQLAGYGAQLYTLRFSRSQEYQADDLGIRYMRAAGYDPLASSEILAALNEQGAVDARAAGREEKGAPTWASTHPNGADRVARARKAAGNVPSGQRNADRFLAAIDGMVYGEDPRQGVVEGTRFRHPVLRFGFTAPTGYTITNGEQAVTVSGSAGQAQLSGGRASGSVSAAVQQTFASLGGSQGAIDAQSIRTTRINGLEAAYATTRANSGNSQLDVTVVGYRMSDSVYRFTLLTRAGSGFGPFASMVQSFAPLSASEAAQVRPKRVRVVTIGAADTVDTLSRRMAYPSLQRERFLTLNGLAAGERLVPGRKVKLIVQD